MRRGVRAQAGRRRTGQGRSDSTRQRRHRVRDRPRHAGALSHRPRCAAPSAQDRDGGISAVAHRDRTLSLRCRHQGGGRPAHTLRVRRRRSFACNRDAGPSFTLSRRLGSGSGRIVPPTRRRHGRRDCAAAQGRRTAIRQAAEARGDGLLRCRGAAAMRRPLLPRLSAALRIFRLSGTLSLRGPWRPRGGVRAGGSLLRRCVPLRAPFTGLGGRRQDGKTSASTRRPRSTSSRRPSIPSFSSRRSTSFS
jgi:hypothetical protein